MADEVLPAEVSEWIRSLEQRVMEYEATGRAAVRLLAHRRVLRSLPSPQREQVDAVFATDTAKAWLSDAEPDAGDD